MAVGYPFMTSSNPVQLGHDLSGFAAPLPEIPYHTHNGIDSPFVASQTSDSSDSTVPLAIPVTCNIGDVTLSCFTDDRTRLVAYEAGSTNFVVTGGTQNYQ